MIQYTLKCDQGHQTDSWFKSAAAYDALATSGHLSCAICGSPKVDKALMAPRLSSTAEGDEQAKSGPVVVNPPSIFVVNPPAEIEKAIEDLRAKVEASSDYVGDRFASEARAMHLGDKPERSIYGEARLDQARDLLEDGVPLMPLPFRPKQKLT